MRARVRNSGFLAATAALLALARPAAAQPDTLRVYGPGGPQGPMQEAADSFARAQGVPVRVVAGPEAQWLERAKLNADLVFGGAEYMLTQFALAHPGLLDERSRVSLYERPAGILVRKGNPKRIRTLADLARPGVRLVDVAGAGQLGLWEDLAGRAGLTAGLQRNVARSVRSSAEAIALWKQDPTLDAWITYESWHYRLRDGTALVRLPEGERLYRGTPIAITARSTQRARAEQFVRFLRSEAGHAIFRRWGWR